MDKALGSSSPELLSLVLLFPRYNLLPTCFALLKQLGLHQKSTCAITDSFKSQYFMRFGQGRQIQSPVKKVNSIIFYTIFYLKG